jgi:cell division protein FtsB
MAHNRKRVTHAKELFYICCILMVLLIGLLSIVGPAGYIEMRKVQAELAAQTARVDALRKFIEHRTNVVNALRDDEKALEEYARKKGYGKKGEIIQEVPPREPETPPASESRPAAPDSRPKTRGK